MASPPAPAPPIAKAAVPVASPGLEHRLTLTGDRPRTLFAAPRPVRRRVQRVEQDAAPLEEQEPAIAAAAPGIQRKPIIGEPDDPFEREANRIASLVVGGGHEHAQGRAAPATRKPEPEPEPPRDEQELTDGGSPLPAHLRTFFEGRIGFDFGHVRIHRDDDAARHNEALRSHAFTFGSHIWLGEGQPLAPTFVLAHELVHVVQQTGPQPVPSEAGKAGAATAPAQTGVLRRVQRDLIDPAAPYWTGTDKGKVLDGEDIHRICLPKLAASPNNVFTEIPVPNANTSTAGAKLGEKGRADLYDASPKNPVGVYFDTGGQPDLLPSHRDSKLGGKPFSYLGTAAPIKATGTHSVIKTKDAPTTIYLGDLKPAYGSLEALAGPGQLDNYEKGFAFARDEVNKLHAAGKADGQWGPITFHRLKLGSIPAEFQEPAGVGQTESNLVLKDPLSLPGKNIVPKRPVKGKLFVSTTVDGIYNYVWQPTNLVVSPSGLPATAFAIKTKIAEEVVIPITRVPGATTQPLLRADAGRSAARPPAGAIRPDPSPRLRRAMPDAKAPEDQFDLEKWKTSRKTQADKWKEFRGTSGFDDVQLETMATRATLAANKHGFHFPAPTEAQVQEVHDLRKIEFWTAGPTGVIGLFRKVFGKTFVTIANFYIKARNKLREMFKSKPATTAGKSGLVGSIIKVAIRVIKAAGKLLINRTMNELYGSLHKGVTDWLKSLFPPEATEALEKARDYVEGIKKDIEDKFKSEVDDLLKETIGPYDDLVKEIDTAAQIASTIADIVNLVKWGARVIACLSPPGWGCLWALAQPVIEWAAGKLVETCWFQQKVAPTLINAISFVRDIPKKLANLIIEKIIKKILPTSLHFLFPAIQLSADVDAKDLECDDHSDGADEQLTPERAAMIELQKELGEEKFAALTELIQKSGIPSKQTISVDEIEKLRDTAKGMSPEDIRAAAGSAAAPGTGKAVPLREFLDAVKQGKTQGGGAGAQKPGDATGGGPQVVDASKVSTDETLTGQPTPEYQAKIATPKGAHVVDLVHPVKFDLWVYRNKEPVLLITNVEAIVFKRTFYPSEADNRYLNIHYRLVRTVKFAPVAPNVWLEKDRVLHGFVRFK